MFCNKKGTREMNANELADKQAFETGELTMWIRHETATMLRQQQAEIEALKKEAALQRLSDFTQEAESFDRTASHMAGEYVSYPAKTLTDEEILREAYYILMREQQRKAQEK